MKGYGALSQTILDRLMELYINCDLLYMKEHPNNGIMSYNDVVFLMEKFKGEIIKAIATFLIPSNSLELKLLLFNISQIPKYSYDLR